MTRTILRPNKRYLLRSERRLGAETHEYLPELSEQLRTGAISRREFSRTACLLGLAAPVAYGMADTLTGAMPFSATAKAQTPIFGGTLRVSSRVQAMTDPATFDWTEKSNVSRFITEYLTRTRADNTTVGYLAESWEASDDLTEWVFHLQKGVTWSNGDVFTSADVAHTVNRWLDPAVGSSNLGLFDALVEQYDSGEKNDNGEPIMKRRGRANAVEVIDDYTIKFNLKQPALAMPENFYNYPTAIVHRGFGVDYEPDLSSNPIGTGPFELSEYQVADRAILRRNRDWWAGDFYLDEIHHFDHGEDTNAWIAALVSDQVDILYRCPSDAIDTIARIPHLELYPADTAQTSVMRFQVSQEPFDNKKLRQAIALCMDQHGLLQTGFQGRGVVGENHHVSPIHPEYFALPPIKQDIERAKALLAEAGYPDGITLSIVNGDTDGPWMTDVCSIFKKQCEPAGITVEIEKVPSSQYWELWEKVPWGHTGWTHRALGTMVLSLAYRSVGPWNECHYNNPDFDAALDAAEAEVDPVARSKKMEVCESILQEDAIIPQPFWRQVYKAANKRVKGHQTHPTFYHQFQNVWLDG